MAVFITGGARSGKSDFAERYAMRLATAGVYIATSQLWDEEMKERVRRHRELREASGFPWRTIEEPYELAGLLRRLDEEAAGERERPAVLVDCLTLWLTNWMLRLDDEGLSPENKSGAGGKDTGDGLEGQLNSFADGSPGQVAHNSLDRMTDEVVGADGSPGQVAHKSLAEATDELVDVAGSLGQAEHKSLAEATDELVEAVAAFRGPLLLVTNEVGSGIVPAYPLGRRFRDEAGRLNRRLAAVCGQAFLVVAGFPLDLKQHAFRLEDL